MGRTTLLILALFACKKTPPQPTNPPPEPDLWGPETLAAWTAEIVPLLERKAERTFSAPPEVELFDPDGYKDFLQREATLIMNATLRDTPAHVREQAAKDQSAQISVYGKYGLYDKKTFLVPDAIEKGAKTAGIAPEDLAKVILAHELGHALQNDTADPEAQFAVLVDLDHFRCWSSVSEGGANYLALQVTREIGLEDVFWTLAEQQGWNQDGMISPLAYPIWMSYGRGLEMFEYIVAEQGMAGFWEWHQHPPISSSMLFAPSTYSPELEEPALDYADVLRGTEQLLTKGDWLVSNSRLGEYVLRGAALRTGKLEEFREVFAHLEAAHHLSLKMSTGRSGDIRVVRFDSPAAAASYVNLLRAEQTVEGQFLAKKLGVTVEVTYADVKGVEGDASLLRTLRVPMGGGSYRETRTAWVARGSHIVSVEAHKFRPGVRLANTLNGVFERLEAALVEPLGPVDGARPLVGVKENGGR